MTILSQPLNLSGEDIQANIAHMQAQVNDLKQRVARITQGGSESARERHKARGKLLVRERIDALLDPGSFFLEIGQFAAYEVYEEEVPCAGVVAGIGLIHGHLCMIVANDATV